MEHKQINASAEMGLVENVYISNILTPPKIKELGQAFTWSR